MPERRLNPLDATPRGGDRGLRRGGKCVRRDPKGPADLTAAEDLGHIPLPEQAGGDQDVGVQLVDPQGVDGVEVDGGVLPVSYTHLDVYKRQPKHRGTLRALGLRGIGKVNDLPDRPEIRGMLHRVSHLVNVEEVTS